MWIQTYKGNVFDIVNPTDDMIDIEDVAHSLSLQCRYNGHCKKFFSVAEHSWIMSKIVSKDAAVYALLHDAAEAYIGDVPRPIKLLIPEIKKIENNILQVLLEKFQVILSQEIIDEVKTIDNRMLLTEKEFNMQEGLEWGSLKDVEVLKLKKLFYWSPMLAEKHFLNRIKELKIG